MEVNETLEAVHALYQLCSVILGKVEAVQTQQDAIAAVLVRSSPQMLEPLKEKLQGLAKAREPDIQPASLDSFRNNILAIRQRLDALASG